MVPVTHSTIVVMVVAVFAVLAGFGMPADARDSNVQAPAPTPTVVQVETDDADVTSLPTTGRGESEPGADALAVDQLVTTLLVLLATAGLTLAGIGVHWRYQRR